VLSINHGDCLQVLQKDDTIFDLVYMDPPFNTGKSQGLNDYTYGDFHTDYESFLLSRIEVVWESLAPTGSLFVHLDWHEVHHIKVAMDCEFGRKNFMNEIIWAYDYGGRSKRKWSTKHDNILWYVKDPKNYIFNYNEMDRIPYMAPGLVGKEKAAKGKTPTDSWWHTIVPTNGKERTGYPTQKPLGILERIVKVHSDAGSKLLDPFAGSGSFGEAAAKHGRDCVLIDQNPQAIEVMKNRLERYL